MKNDIESHIEQNLQTELTRARTRLELAQADLKLLLGQTFRDPDHALNLLQHKLNKNYEGTLRKFSQGGVFTMYAERIGFLRGHKLSPSSQQRDERRNAEQNMRLIPATVAEIKEAHNRVRAATDALKSHQGHKPQSPTSSPEQKIEPKQSQSQLQVNRRGHSRKR